MSKFIIECPHCGHYAEASTGFFSCRTIDCVCGHTIDIKTERMVGKKCPHCGNTVVFDRQKDRRILCPVCKQPIGDTKQSDMTEFFCAQCGVQLQTSRTAETYVCPICNYENDVQKQLAAAKMRKAGLASIIKYEGDDETLIWKHPVEDFNMGSQLIVHESQEAIFFRDGQALNLFGAGRYILETQQLPLLEKLYQLPADAKRTFHSEVYYINLATIMGVKWGTDSKVRLFDPASGLHLEIGASGEFNIKVVDSRRLLLKIVGTTGGLGKEELLGSNGGKGTFRALVMTQVKSYLAQTIKESGINILEIDAHLLELSSALRERINQGLTEYGLSMPEFFVSRIVTPDDDPNFRRMKEQYAQEYLLVRQEQIRKSEAATAQERKALEAQTAAQLKIIGAQGEAEALKIQKAAEAEAYRVQAEAEAMEMRMKGYTYQQETSRQVGMEAMKNGIGGANGVASSLGDLAGLGIGLGAMGSVIGMTKEAILPVLDASGQMGRDIVGPAVPVDSWNCACGQQGLTGNFCPECGAKRPVSMSSPEAWDCLVCGQKSLTGKFCSECGAKRPEKPAAWNCSCGQKGITGNFCPECGKKRGE